MTRADVKAVLDYLLGRQINISQAAIQLSANFPTQAKQVASQFASGQMSYADVYTYLGI